MSCSRKKRDGRSRELRGTARERLLDAALAEFRERGYADASLQGIASRAGLTKGAVYWSFRDKEDLFLSLVDERLDGPARELIALAGDEPAEVEAAPRISRALAALVRDQPDLVLLAIEHWALAVRQDHVRADFAKRQRALGDLVARTLEARAATLGLSLTYPAQRLGTAIVALSFGLAMEKLVEPEAVTEELLGDILSLLYDGLVARAAAEGS